MCKPMTASGRPTTQTVLEDGHKSLRHGNGNAYGDQVSHVPAADKSLRVSTLSPDRLGWGFCFYDPSDGLSFHDGCARLSKSKTHRELLFSGIPYSTENAAQGAVNLAHSWRSHEERHRSCDLDKRLGGNVPNMCRSLPHSPPLRKLRHKVAVPVTAPYYTWTFATIFYFE